MKKNQESRKQSITIPKKALIGIAPLFPIVGILLSRDNPAGLILVGIGVFSGFFIAKGYFEK
ncbi:MAG: hypothetical protein GY861_19435 [bacterium]|nr:hypothetical protein [bacterium]